MSGLDRLVARLDAQRRADAATLPTSTCVGCSSEERLGLAFAPGDRVVDLVTGRRGVVNAGTTETTLVSAPRR